MSIKTIIWIVLGIILLAIIVFALRLKYLYDKVSFSFDLTGLNLQSINFFNQSLQASVQAGIDFKVDNPTNVRLKLRDLSIEIYYQGRRLAKVDRIEDFLIQAKRNNTVKADLIIYANKEFLDLIKEVMGGTKRDIKTYTRFKLLGIPLRIPYTYSLDKEDFN